MLKKSIVLLLFLASLSPAFAQQKLKTALDDYAFHATLIDIAAKFESVVLLDTGMFWTENMKLSGLGFINDIPYTLTIVFQKDTSAVQDLTLFRSSKAKVKEENITLISEVLTLKELVQLKDDSLNMKAPPGETYAYKAGGNTWTLLCIEPPNGQVVYRQSYMPKFYQERYATDDRASFIKTIEAIRDVSKKK